MAKLVGIWKKECLNIKLMYPNPIPISAAELSTTHMKHCFDFQNAKSIFPCNDVTKRHLVESALINHYSKDNLAVNLNNGFSPHNDVLSKAICQLIPKETL